LLGGSDKTFISVCLSKLFSPLCVSASLCEQEAEELETRCSEASDRLQPPLDASLEQLQGAASNLNCPYLM
jgi:hypothetical protein